VPVVSEKLRAIYLNDHLAGATAGHELARRVAGSNEGTELGEFLARLEVEIAEDHDTLQDVMSTLGVRTDPVKQTLGWTAEKFGRLKPNGRILGYSPLSRVIELEGLHIGIAGKISLWQTLAATSAGVLADVDLEELVLRAQRQLAGLEPFRIAAAREAFEDETPVA
jgi:hypothetical protein